MSTQNTQNTQSAQRRTDREVDVVHIPTTRPPVDVDVLVVGAGPSGLGTAIELDRHGVSVAVVDAATEATLARAGAFGHSPRTVEFFRRWGLVERIRDEWTFPPEWNKGTLFLTSLAGHELKGTTRRHFTNSQGSPFSFEGGIRRPQTVLQKVFLEHLAARNIPVSGGWRVIDLEETADGVSTLVEHKSSGERIPIRSRFVVGADGSRSTVRTLAGITRSGEYATERHYRIVVRTKSDTTAALGPFPSATNIIFNNTYSGFLAALNKTDWRVYAGPYALDHRPTDEEFLAFAKSAFGFDVELEVLSATPFFRSTRIADAFHRGRVLLVGDAAHVRTPGGNLGEGFGDVFNLGWKLAAVLRGTGGEALLRSYHEERHPHNERIAAHALERSRAGEEQLTRIRAIGVPDDADDSAQAGEARERIGQILAADGRPAIGATFDERYDRSSVIWYEDDQLTTDQAWDARRYIPEGKPGHRAPNGNIDPYGDSLYDRLDSDVALLVLTPDAALVEPFEIAAFERGIPLEVIHFDDEDARLAYGADYALVRPDHHVAWRGSSSDAIDAGDILDRTYGLVTTQDVGGPAESERGERVRS